MQQPPTTGLVENAAAQPTASFVTPEPQSSEIMEVGVAQATFGDSGTQIFKGFIIGEDYNSDLSGMAGIRVYDRMRRSDPAVRASLKILSEPIIGATYDVEPASDDPQDILIAEQLKWNLFERNNWRSFMRESLTFLAFGHSVFEKCYAYDVWNGNADGQGKGIYLCIDQLAYRKQATIHAWEMRDGSAGIQQIAPAIPQPIEIPAAKLMIFTHEQEGQNYEGISVLRSSYKHWYMKDKLEKIMAIQAERQGVGVPFAEHPSNASAEDKEKAEELLSGMRANPSSHLMYPTGWQMGFTDMKAGTTDNLVDKIAYCDRQIYANVLGQFLTIGGQGMSGSYAASSDQSKLLDLARMSIVNTILDGVNNNLIKQWCELNFNANKFPKVTVSKVTTDNLTELGTVLQNLKNAGVLTPDVELEEAVRSRVGLPDLSEATKENYDTLHAAIPTTTTPNTNQNADNLTQDNINSKTPAVKAVDGITRFYDFLGDQIEAVKDAR